MGEATSRSELDAIKEWYEYNTFVRNRYLRFLRKLPKNVLTRDEGTSYPSILDISTHVLNVYRLWLQGYYETGEEVKTLGRLSLASLDEEERKLDSYLSGLMRKLTTADLYKPFKFCVREGKTKRIVQTLLPKVL